MYLAKKLVLAHFWVAFVAFFGAILLGEWQITLTRVSGEHNGALALGTTSVTAVYTPAVSSSMSAA